MKPLLRWHIGGNVMGEGFKTLRKTILNFRKIYEDYFDYLVCYNQITPASHKYLVQLGVDLHEQKISNFISNIPPSGTMWKLCPPRMRIDAHELIIDNDVVPVKWSKDISLFLKNNDMSLMAESNNFKNVHGRFATHDQFEKPVNSGIVGYPPCFNPDAVIKEAIEQISLNDNKSSPFYPGRWLHCDDQGLLGKILSIHTNLNIIPLERCAIVHRQDCLPNLNGVDFVHFIGVNRNDKHLAWQQYQKAFFL